jgi:uncharacterized protein
MATHSENALGVGLGTVLLSDCNPHIVRIVLGLLILVSGVWTLVRTPTNNSKLDSRLIEALVGLFGGLTGGLAAASSVAPAIWCAARGLNKESQRAVTQPFIMLVQLESILLLSARGVVNVSLAETYVTFLAPLLVGISIGVAIFTTISSRLATQAVLSIVAASGVVLLLA